MKKMTCAELAHFLFAHKRNPVQLEFYAEYDPATEEKSWAFRAITTRFVDSDIVLINYYGGGALFAYEFTDSDTDPSGLRSCLETYFYTADLGNGVWCEESKYLLADASTETEGYWIEDTPFSAVCSICGAARYGSADDPNDTLCPNCHSKMNKKEKRNAE